MTYRLTVTRREIDPNYEQNVAKANERRQYGALSTMYEVEVPRHIDVRTIDVELTEEEYNLVRRSLIQSWETT